MVVHQEDVDARFHISVLEGIVEQYHIHILCLFVRLQSLYSSDSLGVYCHIDVGELLVHLERLVAYLGHRGFLGCQYITAAFSLVST